MMLDKGELIKIYQIKKYLKSRKTGAEGLSSVTSLEDISKAFMFEEDRPRLAAIDYKKLTEAYGSIMTLSTDKYGNKKFEQPIDLGAKESNSLLIKDAVNTLSEYADAVCDEYCLKIYEVKPKDWYSKLFQGNEILPPWIVFPYYSCDSVDWKTGEGEAYLSVYKAFLEALTYEGLTEEYCRKWPTPEYMEEKQARFVYDAVRSSILHSHSDV